MKRTLWASNSPLRSCTIRANGELENSFCRNVSSDVVDQELQMARALFPDEEKAIDSGIEKLYSLQRKRQICSFPSVVLVFVLIVALGSLLLLVRKAGNIDHNHGQNRSIPQIPVTEPRVGSSGTQNHASDVIIRKWKSYLRFKESATLDPIVPVKNSFYIQNSLDNNGNASLYIEIHPKEYCLAVLTRKTLTEKELMDPSLFRHCHKRLEEDLRVSRDLYEIDLGYLVMPCQDIPVVAIMETC